MVWQTFPEKRSRVTRSSVGLPKEEFSSLVQVVQAAGEQQQRVKKSDAPQREEEKKTPTSIREKGESLKEDLDKLIDEIDEVLEENAEEFVKNYVQRGGE